MLLERWSMTEVSSGPEEKLPTPPKDVDTCFAIMPYGGWFDLYYDDIFCPAIKEAGLTPRRADDLNRAGTIIKDIWNYTKQAKVILADLTGRNANVLYELGLAHAIAKPAILLTQLMDDIPFDLRGLRILQYNKNDPNWGQTLKETIEAPLNSVLPTFLEVDEFREKKKVTPHDKEMLEVRQKLAALERELGRLSSPRVLTYQDPWYSRQVLAYQGPTGPTGPGPTGPGATGPFEAWNPWSKVDDTSRLPNEVTGGIVYQSPDDYPTD